MMSSFNAALAEPLPHCGMMCQVMLAGEQEDYGRTGIWPDDFPDWFDPFDWACWPVLAYDDKELHIIAVWSARKGALRRLIAAAATAGLAPVVVGPFDQMTAIMQRWGWQRIVVGEGWDEREEMAPCVMRHSPNGRRRREHFGSVHEWRGRERSERDAQMTVADRRSPFASVLERFR